MESYKWLGPTGYNPLAGYVTHGKPVQLIDDDSIVEHLLSAALIEPLNSQSQFKEENGRGNEREEEIWETTEGNSSEEDLE